MPISGSHDLAISSPDARVLRESDAPGWPWPDHRKGDVNHLKCRPFANRCLLSAALAIRSTSIGFLGLGGLGSSKVLDKVVEIRFVRAMSLCMAAFLIRADVIPSLSQTSQAAQACPTWPSWAQRISSRSPHAQRATRGAGGLPWLSPCDPRPCKNRSMNRVRTWARSRLAFLLQGRGRFCFYGS